MAEVDRPRKRLLRFSLATFLFITMCLGGLLGGYQSGYRAGYDSGQATRYDDTQVTEVYSTASFIWPDLPTDERTAAFNDLFRELKNLIKSTIASEVWSNGSGNEIRDFPTNQSIVVTVPGSVHREIRELFAQLERHKSRGIGEQMLPVLQGLASQGRTQHNALPVFAPKNSQLAHAWLQKYFRLTVDGIANSWGAPDFRGPCTDAAFPDWSLDQELATWPRGDGLAYLGLRYLDDGQLHIVAGWREST